MTHEVCRKSTVSTVMQTLMAMASMAHLDISKCISSQHLAYMPDWENGCRRRRWRAIYENQECITPIYLTLRYVTLRYVTLRYVTLRYVTLRYVTLRYVTLRYVVLAVLIDLDSSLFLPPLSQLGGRLPPTRRQTGMRLDQCFWIMRCDTSKSWALSLCEAWPQLHMNLSRAYREVYGILLGRCRQTRKLPRCSQNRGTCPCLRLLAVGAIGFPSLPA
jgi:hypothetical protein